MSAHTQLPADHPVMVAWEAFKADAEFENTKRWALRPEGVIGSLWAAFYAGRMSLATEFDQAIAECFEVVSTTDVDQNGDHIERRVPKHHLLAADVARLEAENESLRTAISAALESLEGEPEYHESGMGCGLEDRGITDRYKAMSLGWEEAMERVYGENIAWAKDQLSAALEAKP